MRYFIKTNYIDSDKIFHLIDIGIVSEDGREFYAINWSCNFELANDWTKNNVLRELPFRPIDRPGNKKIVNGWVSGCVTIKELIADFFNLEDLGLERVRGYQISPNDDMPEIWSFSSAQDWIVFSQLFGDSLDSLPVGFPLHCLYLRQWLHHLGNPEIPMINQNTNNALLWAKYYKNIWFHLYNLSNEAEKEKILKVKNYFE